MYALSLFVREENQHPLDSSPHKLTQHVSNKQGDQRETHDSGRPVSEDYLASIGVLYRRCPSIENVNELARERGYKNRDQVTVSPEAMGEVYEDKVKSFFHEHLHEDEEIRYIVDGAGYFDVRGKEDEWVRIALEKDDLIVLPPGIYHRFTTDEKNVGDFFFSFCLWLFFCSFVLLIF